MAMDMNNLKKTLKTWENQFRAENGRKPDKGDIEQAPKDIQAAYLQYSKLRRHASTSKHEQPKKEEKEFSKGNNSDFVKESPNQNAYQSEDTGKNQLDSVEESGTVSENLSDAWGKEFDRKGDHCGGSSSRIDMNKQKKQVSSYLEKLGDKMFQNSKKISYCQKFGSKSSSSSIHRRKSNFSASTYSTKEQTTEDSIISDDTVVVKESKVSLSAISELKHKDDQCSDVPPDFAKIVPHGGALFKKALDLTNRKANIRADGDGDGDIVLDKYQIKSKTKSSVLPQNLSKLVTLNRAKQNYDIEDDEGIDSHGNLCGLQQDTVDGDSVYGVACSSVANYMKSEEDITMHKGNERTKVSSSQKYRTKDDLGKGEAVEFSVLSEAVEQEKGKITASKQVVENRKQDVEKEDEKKTYSEFDFDDSMSEDDSTVTQSVKTSRTGKRKAKPVIDSDTESEDRTTEVQHGKKKVAGRKKVSANQKSVAMDHVTIGSDVAENHGRSGDEDSPIAKPKKRKGACVPKAGPSAKRRKTDKGVVVETNMDDEGTSAPAYSSKKPTATRSKPVSSENFVRLNMKVKGYRRKGKGMSGPAYKRMQWKQKMQARSKSYGDKCFKYGQSGHWANKCPESTKTTGDEWTREPIKDEDFPSLQEAAMMAKGIKIDKQLKETDTGEVIIESTETAVDSSAKDRDVDLEVQADIVRSQREEPPPPPAMEPLLEVGENEEMPGVPDWVMKGLKKFGFDQFREGQQEAIMRILSGYFIIEQVPNGVGGLSTLVVLSTGGGKSLCYQLPAFLYAQRSKCITLVVSPLVSLMEDQVTGLPPGVKGVCLHTNMTASQRESIMTQVKDGKAHFLLVSPEAVAGGSMTLLSSMSSLPPIAFVCIDEAHCLSEWSHNFRPSYLRLCKVLHEKFGVRCFLGLTATATLSTASDVARHLHITDFRKATVRGSPIPPNLFLSVSRDDNKDEALICLLQGDRFSKCDSIIIYCTRRDQTDRVATLIRTCLNKGEGQKNLKGKGKFNLEWGAESYHAGLTPAQRKRVQNAFMSGRLRVVVATVAFGMGLDKSDVRAVIHYNMPKSFEGYVQEIGRAGRDGKPAQCHLFLDSEFRMSTEDKLVAELAPSMIERDSGGMFIPKTEFVPFIRSAIDTVMLYANEENYKKYGKNLLKGKDLCELRRHTYANTVDYKVLKRLVQKVFPSCRCRDVQEKHSLAIKDIEANVAADPTSTEQKTELDERICPGHERALPIEDTVMTLDVKEEGIATLLCYLELHPRKWIENLSSVYASCKIQCYGGPSQLQALSKKCPPVAVAIAKARRDGKSFGTSNSIEFPVVKISDTMGWDSGPVKRELKLLQWNFNTTGGGPSKSGVLVEFSDLAFHLRSPGDLTVEELDEVLQFLHERVQRQEKTELQQLGRLYQSLRSVSHKNYWMCCDELDQQKNDKLKGLLHEYFDAEKKAEEDTELDAAVEEPVPSFNMDQLLCDINQFYSVYGHDYSLTGRAIARIFHGISSPCFPASTWGRVRRFWRSHLNVDFNMIMKVATQQLLKLR